MAKMHVLDMIDRTKTAAFNVNEHATEKSLSLSIFVERKEHLLVCR